jgi:dihydrolipoamide dehydrogenase
VRPPRADFLRGVVLLKVRAVGIDVDDGVVVRCDDGRRVQGSHAIGVGSVPNIEASGSGGGRQRPTRRVTSASTTTACRTWSTSARQEISPASCRCRRSLRCRAQDHGRRGAAREHRHLDYDKAASAIFTEPEIADVGLAEGRRAEERRSA